MRAALKKVVEKNDNENLINNTQREPSPYFQSRMFPKIRYGLSHTFLEGKELRNMHN